MCWFTTGPCVWAVHFCSHCTIVTQVICHILATVFGDFDDFDPDSLPHPLPSLHPELPVEVWYIGFANQGTCSQRDHNLNCSGWWILPRYTEYYWASLPLIGIPMAWKPWTTILMGPSVPYQELHFPNKWQHHPARLSWVYEMGRTQIAPELEQKLTGLALPPEVLTVSCVHQDL